jgi:uncharacterized membrane protein YccC
MDAGQVVKRLSRRAIAVDRSKLDLGTGLGCGTGIALPLAIGLATGHPGGGAYVAVGALLTGLATFQPGYRHRVAIMLAVAVSLAAIAFVAGVVGTWTWVVVVLAGCLAFAAGLLEAVGPGMARVSTLGTIVFLIASSQPVPITTALVHAAQIGVGGLLQALVVLSPWPRRGVAPERRTLAAAYRNLSGYATSLPEGRMALPDPKVIEELRASLAWASRRVRWSPGRTLQSLTDGAARVRTSLQALAFARQQLIGLLAPEPAATNRAEAARASDSERARLDQALASLDVVARSTGLLLDAVATSIIDGRPPPPAADLHDAMAHAALTLERLGESDRAGTTPPTSARAAHVAHDLGLVRGLHGQLRSIQRLVTAGTATARDRKTLPYALVSLSTGARAQANAKLLRANLTFESAACRHALRLAAALIVATVLYRTLPGSHEYWIAIAALMVLRPDFDTTITRGLGRAGGTVTGAVLATIIAAELRPGPVALAVLISVIAIVVFTVRQTNYGLYALFWTPLVVFFAALGGLPPLTAAADRAVDNLIGIVLALAVFLVWPTWAATEVPRLLGRLLTAEAAFGRVALDAEIDPACFDRRALDAAASSARLARSNAEAAVERMAIEPDRPGSLTVEAADGIVASVHRFALATVAINAGHPASHPPLAGLVPLRDGIAATLTSLADRLAGQSGPVESDLRRLHAGVVEGLSQAGGRQADVNHSPGTHAVPTEVAVVIGQTDVMVDAVDTIAQLIIDLPEVS